MNESELETTKELKVRVPVRYHTQLQVIKLLKGKNLSEAVREALDDYFSDPRNRPRDDLSRILAGKT